MTREEACKLVKEMLQNPNLIKHCLAVEAIMGALAPKLQEMHPEESASEFDPEEWGIVGLLHDADYEITGKDLARHTIVTEEKLREIGAPERIINGIKAHSETIKPGRENWMEKAVWACDELSGLITAVALVRPDRKLFSVEVRSVMKRFPEKSFAAGAKREQILQGAGELGFSLEEFVTIALKAMQDIAESLGL